MQGIQGLMQGGAQGSGITAEEADVVGRALLRIGDDEIEALRELSSDLKEMDDRDLRALLEVIGFIQQNPDRYSEILRILARDNLIEPGDLPAEYVPSFFAILRSMLEGAVRERSSFAKGGIVSLRKKAEEVRKAGRNGDTMLAHITPEEAAMLKRMGGSGTINPETGLPEFFLKGVGKFLKKAAPVILPVALNFIAPGLGTIASGAIGAGVGSLIAGEKPAAALRNALIGGVAGGVYSGLTGSGGFMQNVAQSGLPSGVFGGAERAFFNPSVTGAFPGMGQTAPTAPAAPAVPTAAAAPAGSDIPMADAAKEFYANQPGMLGKARNFVAANPLTSLGGAALVGSMLSQSGQAQPVPSLGSGRSGVDLLREQPGVYGFDVNQFRPRSTTGQGVVPTPSPAFPTYAKHGGHIAGPGTGTSDSIPAYLSDGEFVLTAKAVKGAGNGSRVEGAKRLYKLMNKLEQGA